MKKTFEEKLQELEKINQNLSQGDLPLERALNEFEAGISLSKECQKTLEAADKRVHILTEKDGNWEENIIVDNLFITPIKIRFRIRINLFKIIPS